MGSSEEKQNKAEGGEKAAKGGDSGTQMKQNTAGLLCYAGIWVTGIIFLIIEKKNRVVRFHAMQALVTCGILNVIWGPAWYVANLARWSAWPGGFGLGWGLFSPLFIAGLVVFCIFFALMWVFVGIAMYRTYHGRMYRVPLFGALAEKCLAKLDAGK